MTDAKMPSTLRYALNYAGQGWRVFPCHSVTADGQCTCGKPDCDRPGKHPRTNNGLKDATTDGGLITRWFGAAWKDANIGVRTGAESGIFVVDVDGEAGAQSLYDFELEHGELPATAEQITGSGGRQLFFKHPGGKVKSRTHIFGPGSGVDIRGDGGYVVVPPSRHVSGGQYEWEASSLPSKVGFASLPAAQLDALNTQPEREQKPALELPEVINDGEGREATLVSLAGSMRRKGMSEDEIYAALSVVNQRRINPPKSDADLRRIARSVASYAPDPDELWRDRQRAKGNVVAEDAKAPPAPAEPPKPEEVKALREQIERATVWAKRAGDTVPAIIPGILHKGALAVMASGPKSGKTWLTYDMLLAITSGKPFVEHYPVELGGRVLYIATEGIHADSAARLKGLALGKGLDPDTALDEIDIVWRQGWQLDSAPVLALLEELAPDYALMAVDVVSKAWSGNEDKNSEVINLLRGLDPIQRGGSTVLLLHHNVKPSEATQGRRAGYNIRGASAWFGELDNGIFLNRPKKADRTTVELETRAGAPSDPFTFTWPTETVDGTEPVTLDWQPVEANAAEVKEARSVEDEVLATVKRFPGIGANELRGEVSGTNAKVDAARKALLAQGLIYSVAMPAPGGGRAKQALYAKGAKAPWEPRIVDSDDDEDDTEEQSDLDF